MAEQEPHAAQAERSPAGVPIWDLVRYYLRLGALGFGGPVALCGQMERELVGERKWLTPDEMREAIAVCQSLPRPLAIQWVIAAVCFGVTAAVQAEVALLFIAAGIVGIVYYGPLFRGGQAPTLPLLAAAPLSVGVSQSASSSILGKLLAFFLKAGSLTFGSGLVMVPFLEKGLVQQTGWLDERQFLVAVAIGMISPGPVVITATFVGAIVAGLWGSLVATVGIFLPSFLFVLIVAPILIRNRANRNVQGFVKGAYAAAIGTTLGACVLLGKIAIGDWLTVLVALLSLVVLFRWNVNNPALVAAAAVVGLIAFPLLQPTWVFIK